MAIKATQLHYDFVRKFNRINSASGRYISVAERDAYLNEGYMIYYENRVALAETNSLIRNDFRQFENKKFCLECKKFDDKCCLVTYPDNYYRLLRTVVTACTDTCSEERELITHIIQSDDTSEALVDPFWMPSYEFEETFADEGKGGLYVYHNGEFNVKKVCIDYYEKPTQIAAPSLSVAGSYVNPEGNTVSKDMDLQLDSTFAWRKIVDVAVLLASRDIGDIQDFQSQLTKILQVEKLYIT